MASRGKKSRSKKRRKDGAAASAAIDDAQPSDVEPDPVDSAAEAGAAAERGDSDEVVEDVSAPLAPPRDRGATSTPEARARLLSEALAHAEMQEARYRVPTRGRKASRIKGTAALTLFALAAMLAIAPPALLVPDPPAQLEAVDHRQGLLLTLLLQAEQIEAFRAREHRLPRSLDEVTAQLPGVRYVRSSNRLYQLVAYAPSGRAVVYDSAAPGPEFDEVEPGWLTREGS